PPTAIPERPVGSDMVILDSRYEVPWKELIKIATSKGYRLYAHGKKHDIYVNDKGERLIVERHGSQEIRKGLMNVLKKQLGF
ncbi:MAG: type II toxin-antitoxin system HicA family toxin, partial [Muribaculaceae bacterium]|nr:type II toxin-antitoxin system HicA family toxin [Muribaculaceae bacterium]